MLRIHGLALKCHIGVYERERQKVQPIWVDLELAIDAAKAAKRDDVRGAIDYSRLLGTVREVGQRQPCKLLETLAEKIAKTILREFDVPKVRVKVKKRTLPGIDCAEVEVLRRSKQNASLGAKGTK